MRKLRSNSKNLRDIRIAYIFLLSLALLCAVMGMIATTLNKELRAETESARYSALTLCADSLHDFNTAATEDARNAAVIKFENAAAQLPSEVDISPLMNLSDAMRENSIPTSKVRALEDTFTLLAAVDYTSITDTSAAINQMLTEVSKAIGLTTADDSSTEVYAPPPEVINYTKSVVRKNISNMLGSDIFFETPALSETGDTFIVENDNMRMLFSASDGSLKEFVHIHLGNVPNTSLSEEEQLSSALSFFKAGRGYTKNADIHKSGNLCGFMSADITDSTGTYSITVDRYGRVWHLEKVKR